MTSADTSDIDAQSGWIGGMKIFESLWRLPYWLLAVILVIVSLARSGFAIWEFYSLYPHLLDGWGEPNDPFFSNILPNQIGAFFHHWVDPDGWGAWVALQASITVLVFVALAVLIRRRLPAVPATVAFAAVAASGIATVLWREVGRYDSITLLGLTLIVLARRRLLIVSGIVLACASSPEQALAASLLLLVGAVVLGDARLRSVALAFSIFAAAATVLVAAWFVNAGNAVDNRLLGPILALLGRGQSEAPGVVASAGTVDALATNVLAYLSAAPSIVWSYTGGALLLLGVYSLWGRFSWRRTSAVLLVVIAPLLTGVTFGHDRTRDLVIVGAPLLMHLVVMASRGILVPIPEPAAVTMTVTAWGVVGMSLIPSLYFFWYYEEPWRFALEHLGPLSRGQWNG